ncbi:hypothetical protein SLA2020_010350 [Shorea laevis]
MVSLVGSNSCGKSTTMSLVSRFYHPFKGKILIDNHKIKDLDLKFLRKNIGAISLEPSLFVGNIQDNIKVGNTDADDEQIKKVALMVNVESFVSQLPN